MRKMMLAAMCCLLMLGRVPAVHPKQEYRVTASASGCPGCLLQQRSAARSAWSPVWPVVAQDEISQKVPAEIPGGP